ncbi:Stk1 family PASTA domain-containing Ser/Thr kinase [Agrococcus casei]|uniref:Stk1 family PASTA domain-containing Ser/Thr kinase n=2 Tax=Agrococcus casei TaxID=343512 RepID=UPI003F8E10FB
MSNDMTDPLIGRVVDGRYAVGRRIARGGMATVYEAEDQRLDRTVAIKVMHPHLADDQEFRERFIQEAKATARISHPNVVNVYDQGNRGEVAYLIMENVPSITLRDHLLKHGAMTPEQSLQVTEAVLAGLSAAHRAELVHRDIKPENILLANDGRIKIGDFGLARAASANTATGKALLGTIAYLSPELVTRGQADKRSDIYAVGIMLFEMLTGKQPFTGEQPMQIAYQHANDQVPAPSSMEPGIPLSLDLLVEWATQREPDNRPSDAGEMLAQVQQVRAGRGVDAQSHTLVLRAADTQAQTIAHRPVAGPVAHASHPTTTAEVVPGAVAAMTRKSDARRRRGPLWLIAALLVAALLGTTGWWFAIGPGVRVDMPHLAGKTYEQAVSELAAAGFEAAPERVEQPDYDTPPGEILSTDPGPGASVATDTVVTITVSSGRQQLEAPDLTAGMSETEAQAAIEEAGFVFESEFVDRRFNGDVERGGVYLGLLEDRTPFAPGDELEERTKMGYIVSLGGIPAQAGQDADEARGALSAVGLDVNVEERESRDVAEGTIIEVQRPDGAIREGSTITLIVSTGPPMVTMPDVVGMRFDEAIETLEALGFTVVTDTNISVERLWSAFNVEEQTPEPGTELEEGSEVTIKGEF